MTTETRPNLQFREQFESFRCINEACECTIPPSNVDSRISRETGVRTIRALCPGCRRMYKATYRLRMGVWTHVSNPDIVGRDTSEYRGFAARIDALTGDVQGNKFAPVLNS